MAASNKIHTHYDNLGIARAASVSDIHAAFSKVGQTISVSAMTEEQKNKSYEILKRSYDVLLDARQRKQYDEWIANQELATMLPVKLAVTPSSPTLTLMVGGFVGMFEKQMDVNEEFIQLGETRIRSKDVVSISAGRFVQYINGIKNRTTGRISVRSESESINMGFNDPFYFKGQISKYQEALDAILKHQGGPLLLTLLKDIERGVRVTIGGAVFNRNNVELTKTVLGVPVKSRVVPYSELGYSTGNGEVFVGKGGDRNVFCTSMAFMSVPNAILVPSICAYLIDKFQ